MATAVELLAVLEELTDAEFKKFKWFLPQVEVTEGFPAIPKSQLEKADRMDTVDEMTKAFEKNVTDVCIKVLKMIKKNDLAHRLLCINSTSKEALGECQRKLKSNLRKMVLSKDQQTKQAFLKETYIDLCIMEEDLETNFNTGRYFGGKRSGGILLTKGVSGSGKTVMTQKFILEWAQDKVSSDVKFVFPLTFREMNLLKEKNFTWIDLLHCFFPETKEAGICNFDQLPIVFILDGLNEYFFPLDFASNEILTSANDLATVNVLVTNLIMGRLFPSASVWITTTPEAACQIPQEYIHKVTELRGFDDQHMDEYFRRRFKDKKLAGRILTSIKASRRLKTLCQIPVLCWITAALLERDAETDEQVLPKTVTEMYIRFTLDQSKLANGNSCGGAEKTPLWNDLLSLGKLAFQQLQRGNSILRQEDLRECVRHATALSEAFPYLFQADSGLSQGQCFYFIHLSFQEFLAALYVFVSSVSSGVNLLSEDPLTPEQPEHTVRLFQSAVDKILQSGNSDFGLFPHFLVGLSMESNQGLFQHLLKTSIKSDQGIVPYIKTKIKQNPSPRQCIRLLQCLNELNDEFLEDEIQGYLTQCHRSSTKLSPVHWASLVFTLLSSDAKLDVFDLQKFLVPGLQFKRMLPLVQASTFALLCCNNLSLAEKIGLPDSLDSALISSSLREVDLSYNSNIQLCITQLIEALENSQSKVETLRLNNCKLGSRCHDLSSVLSHPSNSLKELDLSNNKLEESEAQVIFSVGLASPHCKLETIRLVGCALTWNSCDALASPLSSQSSCLRHLYLSMNNLQDSGVTVFSSVLQSPHCKLESLSLSFCDLTKESCKTLASVLATQTSTLRYLDLSDNNLGDKGVELLSPGLVSPHFGLETLRLSHCKLSEKSCDVLASALSSKTSRLKELDLSTNDLKDSGAKLLSVGLQECRLETLRLSGCMITEDGCSSLAAALCANPSHLRELDLSYNHPGDSGVAILSVLKQDPQWRLDTLIVDNGGVKRLKPGLHKYKCELTLDSDTAHRRLVLSEDNREVSFQDEDQPYPFHPERFNRVCQVLCRNALTGRCYWEVEFFKFLNFGVTYRGISRKEGGNECMLGKNNKSWVLCLKPSTAKLWHNIESGRSLDFGGSTKVAVYLDWFAGSLSFYKCSSNVQTHMCSIYSRFKEPLYPGFGFEIIEHVCSSHSGSAIHWPECKLI
ncbi:NACHT, LRR and PYD domains-containing protein 3-like isoform X1 [Nelusetta ayraudi]|uniref:NACHT, LRR and PYD domains-containing protein 3-like isoform X1 n=2 Tax=Nelusetta ayraudi TaxID=303726 RepID=UPI003F6F9D88